MRAVQEGAYLVVAVSDTGIGIPAAALDSIFEEFWQVEGADKQHQGTGLGLPITKGWTKLLGGTIEVESEVGQGSTFAIRVPVAYKEG
jgi:signal transduction histidine kinase